MVQIQTWKKSKSDNAEIRSKLEKLEKIFVKKDEIDVILSELRNTIKKEFVERIENVEKMIKQKDEIIEALEKRIEKMYEASENKNKKSFRCSECDFQTDSKSGLKIHQKRKHTSLLNENYPTTCKQ